MSDLYDSYDQAERVLIECGYAESTADVLDVFKRGDSFAFLLASGIVVIDYSQFKGRWECGNEYQFHEWGKLTGTTSAEEEE